MEVVVSFTTCCQDNNKVLCRIYGLVIRLVPPKMRQAVYGPGTIEGNNIAECETNYECVEQVLVPKVPRNEYRKYHIEKVAEKIVVSGINKICVIGNTDHINFFMA